MLKWYTNILLFLYHKGKSISKNLMGVYQNIDALHLNLGCHIQEFEGGAGLPTHYSDRLSEEINLLARLRII